MRTIYFTDFLTACLPAVRIGDSVNKGVRKVPL